MTHFSALINLKPAQTQITQVGSVDLDPPNIIFTIFLLSLLHNTASASWLQFITALAEFPQMKLESQQERQSKCVCVCLCAEQN